MGVKSLDRIRAAVAKRLKSPDAAVRLKKGGESISDIREVIPTGQAVLDHYLLGCGGLPVGRISEWLGEESSGKTSLVQTTIASAQQRGVMTVVVEGEYAFDSARAAQLGVQLDHLVLVQPRTLEQAFDAINTTLEEHTAEEAPLLICWDTLASTPPELALKSASGETMPAEVARLCSQGFQKLPQLLARKRAHLLVVNQIRTKFGVMFGNPTTTPGGHALHFYASNRIQVFSSTAEKNGAGEHIGKNITAVGIKSKTVAPFRKVALRLWYASGFDDKWAVLKHAKRFGIIPKRLRADEVTDAVYAQALKDLAACNWSGAGSVSNGDDDDTEEGDD